MSIEETPPERFKNDVIPYEDTSWQEFASTEAELFKDAFQAICERLWRLGITTNAPKLFSAYIGEEWVSMLAVAHEVQMANGDGTSAPVSGQRIIVNYSHSDSLSHESIVRISDYLLCFQRGSMLCIDSELLHDNETGAWDINAGSAPFIVPRSGNVDVHVGTMYQEQYFPGTLLGSDNALEANRLLGALQILSPACQDDIVGFKYQNHSTL